MSHHNMSPRSAGDDYQKDNSFYMKRLKLLNQKDGSDEVRQRSPLQVEIASLAKNSLDNAMSPNQFDKKWQEFKIQGSNIKNRSYASTLIYSDNLYIYGGYQIDEGILDDFWMMNLKSDEYRWKKVKQLKTENCPGKRTRHTAVLINESMVIFGGQSPSSQDEESYTVGSHEVSAHSNPIYCFNFKSAEWSLLSQTCEKLRNPIDSHNAVTDSHQNMIVAFGYHRNIGEYSNAVYSYNLKTNSWEVLFENQKQKAQIFPRGRASSATAIVNEKIYCFGGHDGLQRLQDLWEFNLTSKKWTPIETSLQPKIRSGHSLIYDQKGHLILFGGIHDITWELNDMYFFDLSQNVWIEIDSDSARNKADLGYSPLTKKGSPLMQEQQHTKSPVRDPHSYENMRSTNNSKRNGPGNGSSSNKGSQSPNSWKKNENPHVKKGVNTLDSNEEENKSPVKSLHEKKMKLFQQQKSELLREFDLPENDKKRDDIIRDRSPTSQAMNNSLQIIGNPSPNTKQKQGKLTEFGKSIQSKFSQPLKDQTPTRQGKRPCARDGHQACFYDNTMIIFGGDRHNMSFNTVQILDIKEALGQLD